MINIYPLYSSSSGNLFCIELDDTNILVDCGVSYKAITDGLNAIGKNISDISALLITHEHSDHIKGLPTFCKKNLNIPIYTCTKTAEFLENYLGANNISADINRTSYDTPFKLSNENVEIVPFEISHDAVMPCGYSIHYNGKNITIATDLGYVSQKNMEYFKLADHLILEANYDPSMLSYGKYPYPLKKRIASDTGHLSNDVSADTITNLAKCGKQNFLIAHMSQNNNMIDMARQTIDTKLAENDICYNDLNICYATKNLSCEAYNIC